MEPPGSRGPLRGRAVPRYEYECNKCGNRFTLTLSIAMHDKQKRIRCPNCNSQSVRPVYDSIAPITSKKS